MGRPVSLLLSVRSAVVRACVLYIEYIEWPFRLNCDAKSVDIATENFIARAWLETYFVERPRPSYDRACCGARA